MGHWSIGDFAKELSDIEQLYQIRNESSLVLELVNQLCLKLQSLHQPGPAFALAMFKNIEAAQLPEGLKSKLVLQVEKSCSESSAGPLRVNCAPQSMPAPWNYMSTSEWAKLLQVSTMEAVQVIVARMRKAGIKSLKEDTKKGIVSMLIYLETAKSKPVPPPGEIYQLAIYVKDSFLACGQEALVAGLATYPQRPTDVGPAPWLPFMPAEARPFDKQCLCLKQLRISHLQSTVWMTSLFRLISRPQLQ